MAGDSDLIVARLYREGENALRRHYSCGLYLLCIEAAREIQRLNRQIDGLIRDYEHRDEIDEGDY